MQFLFQRGEKAISIVSSEKEGGGGGEAKYTALKLLMNFITGQYFNEAI
jgi:hypothetical protein